MRFFFSVILPAFCVAIAACDSKTSEEATGTTSNDETEFSRPAPLEGESRFLSALAELSYPAVEAPEELPIFRWDFSKANLMHSYSYEQEVRMDMDMDGGFGGEGKQEEFMSAKGEILIKCQGDSTAELVMKDVVMTMGGSEAAEQRVPPMALQGMQEDGTGPFGNHSQDLFLKILFTLPSQGLEVGESAAIPMKMPYNAMGSALIVNGQSTITLTRYVKIGDRLCAQLDVETDISELKVPEELQGEHQVSVVGKSRLFFDVEQRCFVNGAVALLMAMATDTPAPNFGEPSDEPKRVKVSQSTDNLIKLRLKE